MGKPKVYTEALMLKAIKNSQAIIQTIAKRLDCGWHTAQKYINEWESTKEAYINEEQINLDLCESKLIQAINENDLQSAKWYLAKKGKLRGYGDSMELDHKGEIEYIVKMPEIDTNEN